MPLFSSRVVRCLSVLSSSVFLSGCFGIGRQSALLLERRARGPMADMQLIGQRVEWKLEPSTQTQTQEKVEVTVTFASRDYLNELFRNRAIFGQFAGPNPYFPENLVFHVKITNHSDQRVVIDPRDFVVVDARGNQYSPLGSDYVTAIAESRQPLTTTTYGILEEAHPGYFGINVPVGKIVSKPQGRFALMQRSGFQAGTVYPGVTYDGLVGFWSPVRDNASLQLFIGNLRVNVAGNPLVQKSLDFTFSFKVANQ